MQQAMCHPCNKSSVFTLEYMQQVKCQDEYMQQAKCDPCNKPSFTTDAEYMQQAKCYPWNKLSDMIRE